VQICKPGGNVAKLCCGFFSSFLFSSFFRLFGFFFFSDSLLCPLLQLQFRGRHEIWMTLAGSFPAEYVSLASPRIFPLMSSSFFPCQVVFFIGLLLGGLDVACRRFAEFFPLADFSVFLPVLPPLIFFPFSPRLSDSP